MDPRMLDYLEQKAKEFRCGRIFVATAKASKFYEKNGYLSHATLR